MADKCASAGKTGPTGGGHPADCEILGCGVHCAPPALIESHECDGKKAVTKLVSGEMVMLRVPAATVGGK